VTGLLACLRGGECLYGYSQLFFDVESG
jgi:hypothetical protein